MASTRTLLRSFGAGEMSPFMFGRIDDAKFQAGVARMRNFIATPQGPALNRPGFSYVREVKDSTKKTRIIPFTYSTTQTVIIEVGVGYFRFHTMGGTILSGGVPYEVSNSFTESDLFDIHYVQSNDILTIVHPNHPPAELKRLGTTSWTFTNITFGAIISAPTGVTATAAGYTAVKYTYHYVVTAIASDGVSESVASADAPCGGNVFETGSTNTIAWSSVGGAARYNVYKLQGGIYGYIGTTTGTSLIDDNIAPDMGLTPPLYETVFNSSGNYPGAVSYFEQRRCFAGTNNNRQKIWMTKSGTESDMSYGLPIKDNDRIAFTIAAREANTIRHIVPLSQLVLLTGSAEWRVSSINSDAITPTTISVKPQSFIGANNVQPEIINNSMVYASSRGGHVRELGYSWQAGGFVTADLSLRSSHLFDGLDILDMAFSKAPYPIVWMVSSSGKLLGLTYVPEQSVGSWHWHDTDGVFESVAVVAEGMEDVLYAVVRRLINGSYVRYIERLNTRLINSLEDCVFMDSAATFDGTNTGATTVTVSGGITWDKTDSLTITASAPIFAYPGSSDVGDVVVLIDSVGKKYRFTISSVSSTTVASGVVDQLLPASLQSAAASNWAWARGTISGLIWLEGKTVSVLTDGAVHPQVTVSGGAINLQRPATKVQIGLPYDSDLQTLPVSLQLDGYGQGRAKHINQSWVRVYQSSGIWIGPDENSLVEFKQRTTEPYGSPPDLVTDELPIVLNGKWSQGGQVLLRQQDPLPLTVVGLTLEVSIGG